MLVGQNRHAALMWCLRAFFWGKDDLGGLIAYLDSVMEKKYIVYTINLTLLYGKQQQKKTFLKIYSIPDV